LFSDDKVAAFINRSFEPAWESVRPVPLVRIDFGGGKVLTRTLHGNILTSVCDADGHLLDALPGIYTADAYVDRLNQLRLLAKYVATKLPADGRADWLRGWHARQAESLKKDETPEAFAERRKVPPLTKREIEAPVELVLLPTGPKPEKPAAAAQEAKEAKRDAGDVAGWKELEEDTRLNESTRRRQIHTLLAETGLVPPSQVVRPIYKEVLHADLDDPYLGLGPTLFDNYPFAKEDGGR
jgi:hypothetical protein